MVTHGFHHLAIQVRDLARACAFYRDLLGLRELERHQRADGSLRSVWLALQPGFLALEEATGEPQADGFATPRPGLLVIALRIEPGARDAAVDELQRAGFPIVHQTKWTVY